MAHVSRARRRNQQFLRPRVFWLNRRLDHIINPASPIAPPPAGYERIECRNAHDLEFYSAKMRRQEEIKHSLTMQERYEFEEPIRQHMLNELKANLKNAKDPANRIFLDAAIRDITNRRAKQAKETIESYMHEEGFSNAVLEK